MQHEMMRQLGIDDHDKAPPRENFVEGAERRVRLGLLLRQFITDQELTVDSDRVREHVEEMCAGYEDADEMVQSYLSNPQLLQQIEPVVLEEQAIDKLVEGGKQSDKKFGFKEYMNPPQQ